MNNAPINQPNNIRSITTGNLELRKLWSVPQAEFIYALFVEVKVETAELNEDKTPNWEKITSSELDWRTHKATLVMKNGQRKLPSILKLPSQPKNIRLMIRRLNVSKSNPQTKRVDVDEGI